MVYAVKLIDFENKRYQYNFCHHLLDCTMLLYRLTQNLKTNNTLFTPHIIKIPIRLFITSVHICKGSENFWYCQEAGRSIMEIKNLRRKKNQRQKLFYRRVFIHCLENSSCLLNVATRCCSVIGKDQTQDHAARTKYQYLGIITQNHLQNST